jgi:uncharacterized protein (TIGR00661 family)
MNQPLREKTAGKPRILVAPLDWGLGHATRCIPVIRELLAQGCEVWLAGEGSQEQLLKTEFPELPFLELPGYRINYAKTARGLIWKMILQGPKMQRAIQYEHRWLKKAVNKHGFDAIISDNRYGLYHPAIPSIFITHQLTIKSSLGKWTGKILQKRNYKYINRFTECWVPDVAEENNLAGELSHPQLKPIIPVHYIGLLSRFEKKDTAAIKNHLLIVLSGPEPQRSMLEERIITDISHYNYTATIVRGLPGIPSLLPSTNMIKFYNHLPSVELNAAMQDAEYVISRSGYSTVMDIIALEKKSILIPTPGQTEQEYLGNHLMKKGIALCINQKEFLLNNALKAADNYRYSIPSIASGSLLAKTIEQLLHQSLEPDLG